MNTIWSELLRITSRKQRVLHPVLRTIDTLYARVPKYAAWSTAPTYLTLRLTILSLQSLYLLLTLLSELLAGLGYLLGCLLAVLVVCGVALILGLSMHTVESWGVHIYFVFGGLAVVAVIGGIFVAALWQSWSYWGDFYRYPLYRRWCHECACWRGLGRVEVRRLRCLDAQLCALARDLTLENITADSRLAKSCLPILLAQVKLSRVIYARRNRDLLALEREWQTYLAFLAPRA